MQHNAHVETYYAHRAARRQIMLDRIRAERARAVLAHTTTFARFAARFADQASARIAAKDFEAEHGCVTCLCSYINDQKVVDGLCIAVYVGSDKDRKMVGYAL